MKNMNRKFLSIVPMLIGTMVFAQVGINTENPQVTLHINAKNPQNPDSSAGILIPRVEVNPASGNEKGQLIFNSTENDFYYWDGESWLPLGNTLSPKNKSYFADTKNTEKITMENSSPETIIPNAKIEFTLTKEQKIQFTSTVNFRGRSSAFSPLFKLKLTNKTTGEEEIIDKASNTFLSDGITDYYGNLQLFSLKNLPAGDYKVEVIAYYNDCCNFGFNYQVGGADTPVTILVKYQ